MTVEMLTKHDETPRMQRSRGAGRLSVRRVEGASRIARLYQAGCAKLRLPKGADGLQAVMVNTSGGLTGGDQLDWDFEVAKDAALTVTSQACERIYASLGGSAKSRITLQLERGAQLAWLPQETILFQKGAFERSIHVEMDADSRLLMVEPLIFGRKAMDEHVTQGHLHDRWRIRKSGKLLHAEDTRFSSNLAQIVSNRAVAGSKIAFASLLLISNDAEALVDDARAILGRAGDASFFEGRLVARLIADDSYHLRQRLTPLINLFNHGTPLPKVWTL
ncbi:MAG: urease accessory protein UreD [Ahrensia sp.]|nr:urease accessory protein UreD [Ahrensia sp.]